MLKYLTVALCFAASAVQAGSSFGDCIVEKVAQASLEQKGIKPTPLLVEALISAKQSQEKIKEFNLLGDKLKYSIPLESASLLIYYDESIEIKLKAVVLNCLPIAYEDSL